MPSLFRKRAKKVNAQRELTKRSIKAKKYWNDRTQLLSLLRKARKKAFKNEGSLKNVYTESLILIDLVRDALKGDYDGISQKSLLSIICALLYFVNPFDVIPDFIFGAGFLDDVNVLAYLLVKVRNEIQKYKEWRDGEPYTVKDLNKKMPPPKKDEDTSIKINIR